jgi:hypothetical protein
MSGLLHSFSGAWLSSVTMLAALAAARPAAHAQRANGSLSVAATILPATPAHPARVIALEAGRSGTVRLETAPPRVGASSQLVLCTAASSATASVPVDEGPMLAETVQRCGSLELAPSRLGGGEPRMRFELDLRRTGVSSRGSGTREVTVRVDFLIVPGT